MKGVGIFFGLIFGLLFVAMGGFILSQTSIPTFKSWYAMKNWHPTEAHLISLSGAENDTRARYRYVVAGQLYENDRVYVATFKDNIGSYHQQLLGQLQKLKADKHPVGIWFNPDKPAESVIDRNMRWGLFTLTTGFSFVFLMVGLGVCYSFLTSETAPETGRRLPGLFALRHEWRQKKNDPEYSERFTEFLSRRRSEYKTHTQADSSSRDIRAQKPWLEKKEWRVPRIRSNAKIGMLGMWGFALFWNALSTPMLFALEDEIRKGNYAILIGLIFPFVGIFLIYKAWCMTREWLRYGVIELELDPFPGSIGGHVGGSLIIRNIHDYNAQYKVILECVYSYMTGSGKNRSRSENIKWAESGLAKVESAAKGVRLKFRFNVPDDLPEADSRQKGSYYFWRLKISARVPGVDLEREYNIPVYKTRTESKFIRHDISAQVTSERERQAEKTHAALARGRLDDTALARVVKYRNKGNEVSFYYPMFRNKVLILIALIFAGGFSFAAFMINDNFFENVGIWRYAMLIFSLPFALVGVIAGIAVVYLAFNNLVVVIAGKKIKAVRRLLMFPVKTDVVTIDEIKDLGIKSSGSTGQGINKIEHYQVVVNTVDHRKITVAEDIDGQDLADQFKDYIYEKLKYSY